MINVLTFPNFDEYQKWKDENKDYVVISLQGTDTKEILVGVIKRDREM